MYIRRLFGIDLSGKLRAWARRYNGDTRLFDYTTVWCYITKWNNGTATVTAAAYCSDPTATGLDMQPIARFYSSPSLPSLDEAERHLSVEVSYAAIRFPDTSFYRKLDGQDHIWANGRWAPTSTVPSLRRCGGCGFQTEEAFCPKCGEPIF
ncbi:hypothetical protein GCM10027431_09630 [Lysobacter rhizosphaerae]